MLDKTHPCSQTVPVTHRASGPRGTSAARITKERFCRPQSIDETHVGSLVCSRHPCSVAFDLTNPGLIDPCSRHILILGLIINALREPIPHRQWEAARREPWLPKHPVHGARQARRVLSPGAWYVFPMLGILFLLRAGRSPNGS